MSQLANAFRSDVSALLALSGYLASNPDAQFLITTPSSSTLSNPVASSI
jgi:hypothetical protein